MNYREFILENKHLSKNDIVNTLNNHLSYIMEIEISDVNDLYKLLKTSNIDKSELIDIISYVGRMSTINNEQPNKRYIPIIEEIENIYGF